MRRHGSRRIELVRGAWGLLLLASAPQVLRVDGADGDGRAVVVTRVLGARQLAQAVLSGVRPSPEILALGIWVDGVHAMTAAALAAADPHRARAAWSDAAVAAGWAALGRRDLVRGCATGLDHDRIRDLLARAVLRVVPLGGRLAARARAARGDAPAT